MRVLAVTSEVRGATDMRLAARSGAQGKAISDRDNAGANELAQPSHKQIWANIRKTSDAPAAVSHWSPKSKEFDLA